MTHPTPGNGRWAKLAWTGLGLLAAMLISLIGGWMSRTDAAVRAQEARMAAFEARFDAIKEQLDRVERKLDRLNAR